MKRTGHLFDRMTSFLCLCQAAEEAARGKKHKTPVARFLWNLEYEVLDLQRELRRGVYSPGPYDTFTVHDPKERRICAAGFRDRVVQHALCRVLEPILGRSLISDTYACRTGKGSHRAIDRARGFARRFAYFAKMDVHKFYDSVDHGILMDQLRRVLKDPKVLWLCDVIVRASAPWCPPDKGLPIGNLTSQHFANAYLSGLDHFIKETLGVRGYVRYMDDLVLFADEKADLTQAIRQVRDYLQDKCLLHLKAGATILAPVWQGLPFLGFRIFPRVVRVPRQSWRRFRRHVAEKDYLLLSGRIDQDAWQTSLLSLVAHLQHADTRNLRANFFERPGA